MTLDYPSPVSSLLHSSVKIFALLHIIFNQSISCARKTERCWCRGCTRSLSPQSELSYFCIMHFAPEPAARAAGAPSSAVTQVSAHCQHLPSSVSEMLHARDSHMAMIFEQRSMPCLLIPASKSFKRDHSGSDASTIERPGSPASMVSSCRSVSSMKQLLSLRLQPTPPQPRVDLASWLDNTVQSLQSPIAFNFENELGEELAELSPIQSMSPQAVRHSHNLPPARYREIPIYSDHRSPMIARACFNDEELCYHCSMSDELRIVSDYENAETSNSYGQNSFVDYRDNFDAGKFGSIETSSTSIASSRMSELSVRYHGKYRHLDEAVWVKSSPDPWIEAGVHKAASNSGINQIEQEKIPFESWLDSESSRSSSSFSEEEVLDVCISKCNAAYQQPMLKHLLTIKQALATKLAPAKAHVVELSKILQNTLPNLAGPPKCYLESRPATPYRPSRRRKILVNRPWLTLKQKAFEDSTSRQRQHQVASPSSPVVSNIHWEHDMHSPPSLQGITTSFDNYEQNFSAHQRGDAASDSVNIRKSIIDSIYDVVRDFPQHMLFLDSPCVVKIRRQNYFSHNPVATQRLSIPSSNSSTHLSPLDQLQHPSRRQRTTAKFFAPFVRASLAKNSLRQYKDTSSYVTRPSSRKATDSRLPSLSDPPPPDLSAFRHIFSSTQDWWPTVLYAHLVAYNYMCSIQVIPQHPKSEVPFKASRTLGIPRGSSNRPTTSANSDTMLTNLEAGLVSCITWITNCMMGKSNASADIEKNPYTDISNRLLVRALAEIVKNCEKRCSEKG
jgi:hypothetical protein